MLLLKHLPTSSSFSLNTSFRARLCSNGSVETMCISIQFSALCFLDVYGANWSLCWSNIISGIFYLQDRIFESDSSFHGRGVPFCSVTQQPLGHVYSAAFPWKKHVWGTFSYYNKIHVWWTKMNQLFCDEKVDTWTDFSAVQRKWWDWVWCSNLIFTGTRKSFSEFGFQQHHTNVLLRGKLESKAVVESFVNNFHWCWKSLFWCEDSWWNSTFSCQKEKNK